MGSPTVWDALQTPVWAFLQAFGNGILLPILLVPVGLAVWRWPKEMMVRRRLWWLLLVAAPWVLLGIWMGFNWQDPRHPIEVSPLMNGLALATITLTAVLVVWTVAWMKGARVVAIAAGAVNMYLAAVTALLSIMAMSGNWI